MPSPTVRAHGPWVAAHGLRHNPDVQDDISTEVRRVTDRLRTCALSALSAPVDGWPSRAEAAYDTALALVRATAALEGAPVRALPRVADTVVADQLAVCAADLLAAAQQSGLGESDPQPVLAEALVALRALRLVL